MLLGHFFISWGHFLKSYVKYSVILPITGQLNIPMIFKVLMLHNVALTTTKLKGKKSYTVFK